MDMTMEELGDRSAHDVFPLLAGRPVTQKEMEETFTLFLKQLASEGITVVGRKPTDYLIRVVGPHPMICLPEEAAIYETINALTAMATEQRLQVLNFFCHKCGEPHHNTPCTR